MDDMQMKRFQDRIAKKVDKPRPEDKDFPFTTEMKHALERETQLNQRCPNCKHMNKPEKHHLIVPMRFEILGEMVPLLIWICHQCGMLFAPRWGRQIIQRGMQAHMELQGRIEIDG
jgi:hypothetical protein